MSKELKIGIFALIIILASVWGYKFIQGQNVLSRNVVLYAEFEDVDRLAISTPVLIRGMEVGAVTDIFLSEDNHESVVVELTVEQKYAVPSSAVVDLRDGSLVGGKVVSLLYDKPCQETNCAESGDFLMGRTQNIVSSLVGEENLDVLTQKLKESMGEILGGDSLSTSDMTANLGAITENLAGITEKLNNDWSAMSGNLAQSMRNLNVVTTAFAENEQALRNSLNNLDELSKKLKDTDIDGAVARTDEAIASIDQAATQLEGTLQSAQGSITQLNEVITKMNSTDGSLGMMINSPDLHNNLTRTSSELSLLLQDFRLNPKRYVNVSVFGKKQKEYEVPEDDPAYEDK